MEQLHNLYRSIFQIDNMRLQDKVTAGVLNISQITGCYVVHIKKMFYPWNNWNNMNPSGIGAHR